MELIENTLRQWLGDLQGEWPVVHMVGGAVRDHILSRIPKDIDLMCQDAERFAKRLARTKDAAVVPFLKKVDEPCFRVVDRQNPVSFIDIASMRGDTVTADLSHRDFTINAVAIQVARGGVLGEMIDPLDGVRDMEQGIVRVTGPGAIPSDPLRILRAFRFAASLDFTIEPETLSVMREGVEMLRDTATERIQAELTEIFRTKRSFPFIRRMDDMGVLNVIFPEIKAMKGCVQNGYHHLNVWGHSLLVLEHCEHILNHLEEFFGPVARQVSENLKPCNRLPLLKLTALLHDVGKPGTRGVREDGRITFHGHEEEGAEMVSDIAKRLRMSNQDHDFVYTVVAEHLHVLNLFFSKAKPSTRMRWFRKLKDDCIPLIIHGMADIKATLGPLATDERREKHLRWSREAVRKYYEEIKQQLERQNLMNGKDLIDMGMAPGPEMGRLLGKIREAQDVGQINDREEALSLARELMSGA